MFFKVCKKQGIFACLALTMILISACGANQIQHDLQEDVPASVESSYISLTQPDLIEYLNLVQNSEPIIQRLASTEGAAQIVGRWQLNYFTDDFGDGLRDGLGGRFAGGETLEFFSDGTGIKRSGMTDRPFTWYTEYVFSIGPPKDGGRGIPVLSMSCSDLTTTYSYWFYNQNMFFGPVGAGPDHIEFTRIPGGAPLPSNVIGVTVNGQEVAFPDQAPVIVDGRTLVPVAGVFQAMGFDVQWDGNTRQATLTRNADRVVITIDSRTFTVNGTSHSLDVPAQIIGGRTMLPIADVLRSVGYNVDWDGTNRRVVITSHVA